MKYKLTKSLQRIDELVMLLLENREPLTKQEAARKIGCSRPTLNETIDEANELLGNRGHITFSTRGLVLDNQLDFNRCLFKALINNESFVIQFLSGLFMGEISTIEDWSKTHYVSSSVAYKRVLEVKECLSEVGLTIVNENNDWLIKGDVWQIRFLFFQILKERTIIHNDWTFSFIDYDTIVAFVRKVASEMELYLSPIIEFEYALMVGIHLSMSRNRHALESVSREKYDHLLETHLFAESLDTLEEQTGYSLSEEERGIIISSIELFPVEYLTPEAINRRIVHSRITDHHVYQLALVVSKIFHQGDENENKFVTVLDVFTPFKLVQNQQSIMFELSGASIEIEKNDYFKSRFLEIIEEIDQSIVGMESSHLYFDNREIILRKLFSIYEVHYADCPEKTIKIAIFSQYGRIQEELYKKYIKHHMPFKSIEFLNSKLIHQTEKWQEVDISVTDYSSGFYRGQMRTFYVDDMLDYKSLVHLERLINDMSS